MDSSTKEEFKELQEFEEFKEEPGTRIQEPEKRAVGHALGGSRFIGC
jgi:hypothetical protein